MALPDERPEAMEPFQQELSSTKLEVSMSLLSQCVKYMESLTLVFNSSDGSMDKIPSLLWHKRPSRIFHAKQYI